MKVYLARRNADMTEGRGPMLIDLCFLHRDDAVKYIDNQSGVMGRRFKWSEQKYGDWDIVELDVMESLKDAVQEKRCENCAYFGNPDVHISYCYRIPGSYPLKESFETCTCWSSSKDSF